MKTNKNSLSHQIIHQNLGKTTHHRTGTIDIDLDISKQSIKVICFFSESHINLSEQELHQHESFGPLK